MVFVYIIEIAQTLIMTNDCWNTFVKGFGHLDGLDDVRNSWLAAPIFTAIGERQFKYKIVRH